MSATQVCEEAIKPLSALDQLSMPRLNSKEVGPQPSPTIQFTSAESCESYSEYLKRLLRC